MKRFVDRRARSPLPAIFLLLFSSFNSVKQAVLIILNIPFALIGGILALVDRALQFERQRQRRLHRALRCRRAQRRCHGELFQRAAP